MSKENRYRLKFYLNARHFLNENGKSSEISPHTWEVGLFILKQDEEKTFREVEKKIEAFFDNFDNQLINDIPPFNLLNPTTENIGKVFYKQLSNILSEYGRVLETLQISENPTRTYIVNEYESYFHDLRKQVEADIERYKINQDKQEELTPPLTSENKDKKGVPPASIIESKKEFEYSLYEDSRQTKRERIRRKRNKKVKIGIGVATAVTIGIVVASKTYL
ncbi:6-carboxytetrahydropterin synthase (plasmid) [Aneurinibacillus sp. Ricciae_BoGa-3]|uniref:6-carboxytetrahydropterin synthase n=1 Tax=Aneurinibacillus sp. Ricciae_BoGa-3 TaxID=3022697 RepID=UPI002340E17B|nr:6-carboxytetrahydropterin synthase [Aneurinibacillus sp. Ricciae_BoGa-3]WCK57509.1 6-carboxytetrahydropterin synthase [Aneurinibacillus sp. Ricciae_BoGa-3]